MINVEGVKIMKKLIALLLAAVMVFPLSACGQKKIAYDVAATADKLVQTISFEDEMSELPESMLPKLYNIEEQTLTAAKVYVSTGATAEEVAVFEAKTSNDAKTIENAAKARIEKQKNSFRDYVPEEMPKLENPVIVTEGNYVILCVSNQNDKAKEIINSMKQG